MLQRLVGQRPGRADRGAFPAGHATAAPHGDVEIEGNAGAISLTATGYDMVVLQFVAAPDAAIAENASLVIDCDHRRAIVTAARMPSGTVRERDFVDALPA